MALIDAPLHRASEPRVSFAIPLFNEEAMIGELLRRVLGMLDRLPGGPHELVAVDDGSSDRTFERLCAAAEHDSRIKLVGLSRNFGHQAALTAALDHVSGDVVMVIDADLQDPPEILDRFLDEYRRGYDVVYAIRRDRPEGWLHRAAYYLFYRLVALLSDRRLPLDAGDCSLMTRPVVDAIQRMREPHRYLRGLRAWSGFRQIGIEVQRRERFAGESKYDLLSLTRLAFDAIFSFSVIPLRAATLVGLTAILATLVYVAYAVVVKVTGGVTPQGFTALIAIMTFLSGVQLLFLGVIGEYLGRLYEASKSRPLYVVSRTSGLPSRH